MKSLKPYLLAMSVLAFLFAGCSQASHPTASDEAAAVTKAPTIPAGPVTAKAALGPAYRDALSWSSDVELMRISPKTVPGINNEGGKAAMWETVFASPSLHQMRIYDYSVASAPDIRKGVNAGLPLPWTGPTRDAMPIDMGIFSVDSDAAYQASASDAATWLKTHPKIELASLDLGSTYKFQAPVWYISWGDKKTGYITLVDATTGKVYKHK